MSRSHIPSELRRQVYDRAGGRCEYCGVSEADTLLCHQVDHVIAEKHGGATEADNLALCCQQCNSRKGSDIASLDPESGLLVPLFHPRTDRWSEHFRFHDGWLLPQTPAVRATARLLRLNDPRRISERRCLLNPGPKRPPAVQH